MNKVDYLFFKSFSCARVHPPNRAYSSPNLSYRGFADMYRRIRKPNYSHEETMALLQQMETHRHILFGKAPNHQRSELWAFIAETVNAVPTSKGRTIEELKHRWKDLSHKTRYSLRNFSKANASKDEQFVPPSIYFDIVMRILGNDVSDMSEINTQSRHDGQNSSQSFIDDSHNYFANSEVDIKPDINIINNFIIGAGKPNNLKMNQSSTSTSSSSSEKCLGISDQNANSSKNIHQFTPTSSENVSVPPKRKFISDQPKQTRGTEENRLNLNELSTSAQNGVTAASVGQPSDWRSQTQASNLRPMRLDPITQEVTEVDGLDLDSDTSEDSSSCSKLTVSVAEEGLLNGRVYFQENAGKSASSTPGQPARKRRKLDVHSLPTTSLSVEDLQKLYLIKKIKMMGQRTRCFQLLEQKFQCEINLLKQQGLRGSRPSFNKNSRNPKVFRLYKGGKPNKSKNDEGSSDEGNSNEGNSNEGNSNEGIFLQECEVIVTENGVESCGEGVAINSYCNVENVDNDSNADDDNECEQKDSSSCDSSDNDSPDVHEGKVVP